MRILKYGFILALSSTQILLSLTRINYLRDSTQTSQAKASPHLNYYGGPVVSNVQVVDVLWGPNVNTQVKNSMPAFFAAIINSTWIDWFCEYNTQGHPAPTTNQLIGRGTFIAQTMITPSTSDTTLTDAQIQTEIIAQLDAGNLPAPQYDADGYLETIYVIEFPPGISIDLNGSFSCQSGGFCAYHGAIMYQGKPIMYAVEPDFGPGSGCDVGCGTGTMLQNQQSVHSHELAEAITDPEVNFASSLAPPFAWYDPVYGENGDICNGEEGPITINGTTYTVQKEWSNSRNACIITNSNLAAAPTIQGAHTVPTGGTTTLTAQGSTAPYQWYLNDTLIPDNTSATLTITNASSTNTGDFYVRGRCTNVSSTFSVSISSTTTTTNKLVVNSTDSTGDGIVINATSPASGKQAIRYVLNGANVFTVSKSTGQVSVDTTASGSTSLSLATVVGALAIAINSNKFTVDALGNSTNAGNVTAANVTSENILAAGGLAALNGGINVNAGKFTVEPVTGTMISTGNITAANITSENILASGGLAALNGGINVNAGTFTVEPVTGNTAINGTLAVTDTATFLGPVTLTPTTSSTSSASTTINQRIGMATFTGFTTSAGATQVFTINNSTITTTSPVLVTVTNLNASGNGARMGVSGITQGAGTLQITTINNGIGALGSGDNVLVTFWVIS